MANHSTLSPPISKMDKYSVPPCSTTDTLHKNRRGCPVSDHVTIIVQRVYSVWSSWCAKALESDDEKFYGFSAGTRESSASNSDTDADSDSDDMPPKKKTYGVAASSSAAIVCFKKIYNQVWVLKSMKIRELWTTKYIEWLVRTRQIKGFGTIGPTVKELEFRPGFRPFPMVCNLPRNPVSIFTKTHELSFPFWPCGYECCLLTMKL